MHLHKEKLDLYFFCLGIKFFTENGFLAVSLKDGPFLSNMKNGSEKFGKQVDVEVLDQKELKERFPFVSETMVTQNQGGLLTLSDSGHINPRRMITAQKILATRAGCDVINDVVKRVVLIGGEGYEIEAERSGQRIRGKKVLLAPGCFMRSRDLLPKGLQLKMDPITFTILLVSFPATTNNFTPDFRACRGKVIFSVCLSVHQGDGMGILARTKTQGTPHAHT